MVIFLPMDFSMHWHVLAHFAIFRLFRLMRLLRVRLPPHSSRASLGFLRSRGSPVALPTRGHMAPAFLSPFCCPNVVRSHANVQCARVCTCVDGMVRVSGMQLVNLPAKVQGAVQHVMAVPVITPLGQALRLAMPLAVPLLATLFCLMMCYAALGVALFGGLINKDPSQPQFQVLLPRPFNPGGKKKKKGMRGIMDSFQPKRR